MASHVWLAGGRPRGLVIGTFVADDELRRLLAEDTTSDQDAPEIAGVVDDVVCMDLVTGREADVCTGWSR